MCVLQLQTYEKTYYCTKILVNNLRTGIEIGNLNVLKSYNIVYEIVLIGFIKKTYDIHNFKH